MELLKKGASEMVHLYRIAWVHTILTSKHSAEAMRSLRHAGMCRNLGMSRPLFGVFICVVFKSRHTRSFVRSFVHLFVRSFVCSFVHSLIRSLIN